MNVARHLACGLMAVILVAGVARLIAGDDAKKEDGNKEALKQLQGPWKVVSGVKDGQEIELFAKLSLRFTFKDEQVTIESESDENVPTQTRKVRVDAGTNPKLLDLSEGNDFSDKDKVVEGLYSLDGDTLKWCFVVEGDQAAKSVRPGALESKDGSNTVLLTLKKAAE